jgi:LPPG:FO 2-phospho-L-lactate transferase
MRDMRLVALAGGVGAAKLLLGLTRLLRPDELTVVVNTGDDFTWMGLHVSPDLDTVSYTLAGMAHRARGWGLEGDTFRCLGRLEKLGAESWFAVGDADLATHIFRTECLRRGLGLAETTARIAGALGVPAAILPMSEQPVATIVNTADGPIDLQDYFVRRRCAPPVAGFSFRGIEQALPGPGVIEAMHAATAIVICPSNPFISIGPILAVPGLRQALRQAGAAKLAVTPVISGQAVKGPTCKMMTELNLEPSARTVAKMYGDLVNLFVLDIRDEPLREAVEGFGLRVVTADTLMESDDAKERLARNVLEVLAWRR